MNDYIVFHKKFHDNWVDEYVVDIHWLVYYHQDIHPMFFFLWKIKFNLVKYLKNNYFLIEPSGKG